MAIFVKYSLHNYSLFFIFFCVFYFIFIFFHLFLLVDLEAMIIIGLKTSEIIFYFI